MDMLPGADKESSMDYQKALEELKTKLINDPDNDELMSKVASAQMEAHDFQGALITLREAVKLKPNTQTMTNLGYFLTYEGEPFDAGWQVQEEKAIMYLKEALKLCPKTHHAYSLLGEVYLKVGRYCDAETVLKQAIAFCGTFANQNNLGVALFYQGQYEQAAERFLRSYALRSDLNQCWHPYESYGFCLAKLGKEQEALSVAGYLLRQGRSNYDIYLDRVAKIFYQVDDLENCGAALSLAIEHKYSLAPDELSMRIYTFRETHQVNMAEDAYREAIAYREEKIAELLQLAEPNPDYLIKLRAEIQSIQDKHEKILYGLKPCIKFIPSIEGDCYLFGCLRHNNPY